MAMVIHQVGMVEHVRILIHRILRLPFHFGGFAPVKRALRPPWESKKVCNKKSHERSEGIRLLHSHVGTWFKYRA